MSFSQDDITSALSKESPEKAKPILKSSKDDSKCPKYDKGDKGDKCDRGDRKSATERYAIFYSAPDTKEWDIALDQALATNETEPLYFFPPKTTLPLRVVFADLRSHISFSICRIQPKAIDDSYLWSEQISTRLEGTKGVYKVGKALLNLKPEDFSLLFPEPSLLLMLGLKHEKDLIELFNIVLKTPDDMSKALFFKACLNYALDTEDLRLLNWLLQNEPTDASASPAMLTSFNMASGTIPPLLDAEKDAKPKQSVDNK